MTDLEAAEDRGKFGGKVWGMIEDARLQLVCMHNTDRAIDILTELVDMHYDRFMGGRDEHNKQA